MATSQLWTEVQSTLKKDLPTTSVLNKLLTQERTALEQRDYETIQAITKKKQLLIIQLKKNANARMHAVQAAGFKDEASILAAAKNHAPIIKLTTRPTDSWVTADSAIGDNMSSPISRTR